MVRRGNAVVHTRWWWWGCVFAKCKARSTERVGQKNLKPSCRGSVSGCSESARGREGGCGVTAPPSHAKLEGGMGGEVVWWVVVVVLTCCPGAPPVSLFLLNPLSSPLYPNPHYSPLVGCVTSFVVGHVVGGVLQRACHVWRSFKHRPFSIAFMVLFVTLFINLLKS